MTQSASRDRRYAEAVALAACDPAAAARLLADILEADPGHVLAHNLREQIDYPNSFRRWMRVNCEIHPEDDLFWFFVRYPGCRDPIRAYLSDGWRSLCELMVLLERWGRPLLSFGKVHEFAAGFGRFTRHLAPLLGERLSAAEIVPEAVRFLRERLGVRAVPSAHDPERFALQEAPELLFALSFFTHLPPARWRAWLLRFARLLAPGGWLLITTHGDAAIAEYGVELAGDQLFLASSESRALAATDYGTTFLRDRAIAQLLSELFPAARIEHAPRAFWLAQDAWLIVPEAGACG